jgi:hypothetical protein
MVKVRVRVRVRVRVTAQVAMLRSTWGMASTDARLHVARARVRVR